MRRRSRAFKRGPLPSRSRLRASFKPSPESYPPFVLTGGFAILLNRPGQFPPPPPHTIPDRSRGPFFERDPPHGSIRGQDSATFWNNSNL